MKYYPVDLTYFVKRLVTLVFPARGFSGVFLFSKTAWMETEDEEAVKRIPKAQDTFLSNSIKKRYATRHVWLEHRPSPAQEGREGSISPGGHSLQDQQEVAPSSLYLQHLVSQPLHAEGIHQRAGEGAEKLA